MKRLKNAIALTALALALTGNLLFPQEKAKTEAAKIRTAEEFDRIVDIYDTYTISCLYGK